VVTPETDALEAKVRQLRRDIEEDLRRVRSAGDERDSGGARHVVSDIACVGLLGLVLVLVAGLLGLSSGALAGIAAVALGVALMLVDRAGKRSA
jgi:Flp pilus assembly protein TadB